MNCPTCKQEMRWNHVHWCPRCGTTQDESVCDVPELVDKCKILVKRLNDPEIEQCVEQKEKDDDQKEKSNGKKDKHPWKLSVGSRKSNLPDV